MIGIVVISHSHRLAEAAMELAAQMVPSVATTVRLAAGAGLDETGEPVIGTDASLVARAIDSLADAGMEAVVMLMDLGSAVLSAELALELRSSTIPVRPVSAPFVEGLLAAVVCANGGGTLAEVAEEARRALDAKTSQLGESGGEDLHASVPDSSAELVRLVRVVNPLGIHARPAALIAEMAAGFSAELNIRALPGGKAVNPRSLTQLLTLGAGQGSELKLSASGDDATASLEKLVALIEGGFGELGTDIADTPVEPETTQPIEGRDDGLWRGLGVSEGQVAAPLLILAAPLQEPNPNERISAANREDELARILPAAHAVAKQLQARASQATAQAGDILHAAALIATDPELIEGSENLVREEGLSPARAVWVSAENYAEMLSALGGRMAERVSDIRDVRNRLVAELLGLALPGVPEQDTPFVLVAEDLSPADTATLGESACVALVTELGGATSHTAIMARAFGLPAVVALRGALSWTPGTLALVDGAQGTVLLNPTPAELAALVEQAEPEVFGGHGMLADATPIPLMANVGMAADARRAEAANAEGVGLFRTEFCFLDRQHAPSVLEQVSAYREIFAPFSGKRVTVRTLDSGSDKPLPFVKVKPEENPALGVRGVRVARNNPSLLVDQLAALAEAARLENALVEVMAPMIATVQEAIDFAEQARAAGISRVGAMIETPSAALLAEELCAVLDFVSLGTNDLNQYTMAADRMVSELADLADPWQPAVLRLIKMVTGAGRASGTPVGVCGEAAGDPLLAAVLVGLGATSLSMTPRLLGPVAKQLSSLSFSQCELAASFAISASDADQARRDALAALGE